MNATNLITEIVSFFSDPSKWTSGACARDENDNPVGALSPNAVKWDVQGYLIKLHFENNGTNFSELNAAYAGLQEGIPSNLTNRDIEGYNDTLDAAGVLDWLNGSIEAMSTFKMKATIRHGQSLVGSLTVDHVESE